jgi:hypothetical protein
MATLAELRKKPEASLTPAEKIQLFGDPGAPVVTLYARKRVNGRDVIVARNFLRDDQPGDEWVDTPAKLGAPESAPATTVNGVDITETVIGAAPPLPGPEPAGPRRRAKVEE